MFFYLHGRSDVMSTGGRSAEAAAAAAAADAADAADADAGAEAGAVREDRRRSGTRRAVVVAASGRRRRVLRPQRRAARIVAAVAAADAAAVGRRRRRRRRRAAGVRRVAAAAHQSGVRFRIRFDQQRHRHPLRRVLRQRPIKRTKIPLKIIKSKEVLSFSFFQRSHSNIQHIFRTSFEELFAFGKLQTAEKQKWPTSEYRTISLFTVPHTHTHNPTIRIGTDPPIRVGYPFRPSFYFIKIFFLPARASPTHRFFRLSNEYAPISHARLDRPKRGGGPPPPFSLSLRFRSLRSSQT